MTDYRPQPGQQPYEPGQPYPPHNYGPTHAQGYGEKPKNHGSLGTAALVLGIIGFVFGCIPFVNYAAFPIALLAIVFGVIAWRWGKGKAGAILGLLGIVAAILWSVAIAGAFKHASHQVNDYSNCLQTQAPDDFSNDCDQYLN